MSGLRLPFRACLLLLVLAANLGCLPSDAFGASAARPNIVLFFIDDLGYGDIGPFGNKQVRTPHLDRFAKEGRKFTSFYATPVCSMSRAALMTGCYNTRVSIPGVLFPGSKVGLNPAEITVAEVMKQQGYSTACFGKWHLGHQREFLPTRQGFDYYFGLPYSNDMKPLPLMRGEDTLEMGPDQNQLTRRYTEETIRFIDEHKDKPFFVYLAHTMIHLPLAASKPFRGQSALGEVGDAIEEVDWSVGQVMDALRKHGLDDKTLVLFTSDNGPAGRTAGPFRGNKTTVYEGGVREPCIMRWPGKIPAGTECDQIAGNIDVLPTLANLSGGKVPDDRVIDGRDISTLLFDDKPAPVRSQHLHFNGAGKLAAIRQDKWKLIQLPRGKQAKKKAAGPELYDLSTDPGESKNLAAEHPDIVEKLRAEAAKCEDEINAHKRPAGKLSDAK